MKKLFKNHSFLKYPLLVKKRNDFLKLAEKEKIKLGDWFLSPLHPVQNNLQQWNFDKKQYPIAVKIASQIVNLPTDTKNIEKNLSFLKNNLKFIK